MDIEKYTQKFTKDLDKIEIATRQSRRDWINTRKSIENELDGKWKVLKTDYQRNIMQAIIEKVLENDARWLYFDGLVNKARRKIAVLNMHKAYDTEDDTLRTGMSKKTYYLVLSLEFYIPNNFNRSFRFLVDLDGRIKKIATVMIKITITLDDQYDFSEQMCPDSKSTTF